MLRSVTSRQSDSAKTYLDFSALSPALDAAAQLAALSLGFPISMINILDGDTQYTLAQFGSPAHAGNVVPRSRTVCANTVESTRIVEIADAYSPHSQVGARTATVHGLSVDPEPGSSQELLAESGLAAYVGIALTGREGLPIGVLCVFDTAPHPITDSQRDLLPLLAVMVEEHLDSHRNRTPPVVGPTDAVELAAALAADEVAPWYQPIVDLDTGSVVAVEALARWNHPSRGVLGPANFIAVAETSELIIDLDLAVLGAGAVDLRAWLPIDPGLVLHVNLSGAHFAHPNCVDRLTSVVRAAGVDPGSVVLEITESVAFAVNSASAHFVGELRRIGFGVVLDDIGAGWSGLERLVQLPLTGFKVDKAVTDRLGTTAGDAMMRALHSLSVDLGMSLTVEGVETAEQARAVAALGSVQGQGYWWARPTVAASVADFLSRDLRARTGYHTASGRSAASRPDGAYVGGG